jgi:hypothetical protein
MALVVRDAVQQTSKFLGLLLSFIAEEIPGAWVSLEEFWRAFQAR